MICGISNLSTALLGSNDYLEKNESPTLRKVGLACFDEDMWLPPDATAYPHCQPVIELTISYYRIY